MTQILASLFNLAGPDLLIILIIFAIIGIPIFLVLGGVFSSGRSSSAPPPPAPPQPPRIPSTSERLQRLDQLKQQGLITDVEYEEQRRRILESI